MDKQAEIAEKAERLTRLLAAEGLGGVVLVAQPNFAWLTAGGNNGIDTFDLAENYRLEQGFTYELNLYGDGSKARDEFVQGQREVTR